MSTREVLQTGTIANDGTGDTLRDAADKINTNFANVWTFLGGTDSDFTNETITVDGAASTTAPISFCSKGSALAITLADATTDGTSKKFVNVGSGTATITPSTTVGSWTDVAVTQGRGVEVVWHSTGWTVVGADGITVS